LQAQKLDDLSAQSLTAMRAGEWEKAHALLKRATDAFDGRAPTLIGPRFGWFWYHQGYCELKLRLFDEATKSFEKCYKKYANKSGVDDKNQSVNLYHTKSLLMWGHAAKGGEKWDDAIKMYNKFLQERDPGRDKYERGVFYINMAVCHFKLRKIGEGSKYLETAIKNKITFPTPNKGIMSAFHAMVEAVIDKKDEKSLLDFIAKNRGHIKLEPFEAYEFAPLFMKLAQDAKSAEMMNSTFELYALVPSTVGAIDDVKARLDSVGMYTRTIKDGSKVINKAALEADLESLEDANTSGKMNEVYAFLNTAVMHEEDGNVRGAFAVYEQLELYYPHAKVFKAEDKKVVAAREKNLYHLVRTSSIIGEVLITEYYGSRFLKDFPKSEHVEEVRRMMLTSLFWQGEYEKCIEVASKMIDNLPKPSEQHDICLFVLGGSYHYTAEFVEAQPLLDLHVKTYGDKDTKKHRRQAALYFQASNLSRLQYFTKSAALLDAFLSKYPEPGSNPYYPFALFDRSNCHYAENELEPALVMTTRVEEEFPGVEIMEMNFNLKGNILEGMDQPDPAEEYYKKALEMAERKQNDIVAGESLFYLVNVIGTVKVDNKPGPRVEESVPFYNKFWEEYGANSPYKVKVAVAGLPGMRKVGKFDEALERLQGVIADLASEKGAPDLEAAVGSYTEAYLETHTPEELKDHYYNFPRIKSSDKAARALLRVAIIGVFEDVNHDAIQKNDEAREASSRAMVKVLFNELKADFDLKDLSNYILVRVGEFIRKKSATPLEARPYYEEALSRANDQSYKFPALFGVADILGSGSKSQKEEAIKYLQRVFDDAEEKSQKEEALMRMVSVLYDKGDFAGAVKKATLYLETDGFKQSRGDARYLLAKAYDANNQKEDARMNYGLLWGANLGLIKVSAPSIERWMQLTWERDGDNPKVGKSDRQLTYEKGWKYIDMTRRLIPKMSEEEVEIWKRVEALVQEYEDSNDTISMAEINKRKGK
ncbi:hypothetical protein N9230_05890, partial [Akkermansiaceae bacterium]|nr:hypothetical protein [Akkermansiaceae bacterium]